MKNPSFARFSKQPPYKEHIACSSVELKGLLDQAYFEAGMRNNYLKNVKTNLSDSSVGVG